MKGLTSVRDIAVFLLCHIRILMSTSHLHLVCPIVSVQKKNRKRVVVGGSRHRREQPMLQRTGEIRATANSQALKKKKSKNGWKRPRAFTKPGLREVQRELPGTQARKEVHKSEEDLLATSEDLRTTSVKLPRRG